MRTRRRRAIAASSATSALASASAPYGAEDPSATQTPISSTSSGRRIPGCVYAIWLTQSRDGVAAQGFRIITDTLGGNGSRAAAPATGSSPTRSAATGGLARPLPPIASSPTHSRRATASRCPSKPGGPGFRLAGRRRRSRDRSSCRSSCWAGCSSASAGGVLAIWVSRQRERAAPELTPAPPVVVRAAAGSAQSGSKRRLEEAQVAPARRRASGRATSFLAAYTVSTDSATHVHVRLGIDAARGSSAASARASGSGAPPVVGSRRPRPRRAPSSGCRSRGRAPPRASAPEMRPAAGAGRSAARRGRSHGRRPAARTGRPPPRAVRRGSTPARSASGCGRPATDSSMPIAIASRSRAGQAAVRMQALEDDDEVARLLEQVSVVEREPSADVDERVLLAAHRRRPCTSRTRAGSAATDLSR